MAIATAYSSVISHYITIRIYLQVLEIQKCSTSKRYVLAFIPSIRTWSLCHDRIQFVFRMIFHYSNTRYLIYDRHSYASLRDHRSVRDVLCGDLSLYTRPLDERLTSRRDNLPTWRFQSASFHPASSRDAIAISSLLSRRLLDRETIVAHMK